MLRAEAESDITDLMTRWRREKSNGDQLKNEYQENCTWEMVQVLSADRRRDLRNYLRDNGVRVKSGPGYPILLALKELLHPHVTGSSSASTQSPILSQASQPNTLRGVSDLLKFFSNDTQKYGGHSSENLHYVERNFRTVCKSLNVPDELQASNIHVVLKDIALDFYYKEISGRSLTCDEVFISLRNRFYTIDRRRRVLDEWNHITMDDFRIDGTSETHALEALVKRATELHEQLDGHYRDDIRLREMLLRAMQK